MRRAAKVDDNQGEIVRAFRQLGCTVAITSQVGGGFPDLVVGVLGENLLVEIKDGSKPPSARKLTPDQVEFHRDWRGQVCIIETEQDVIDLVNQVR